MKNVLILLLITFVCATNIVAQSENNSEHVGSELSQEMSRDNKSCVVFSKFKLDWFNIMGMRGGGDGQRLRVAFKNNSNETLKYVTVHYWPINSVNDITGE